MRIFLLGGMGALASSWIHDHIVRHVAESGVACDSDFPEIVHHSLSVSDNGFDGDFAVDFSTSLELCEVFSPDLIVSCCLSISNKLEEFAEIADVLTPLDALRDKIQGHGTILSSDYAARNFHINRYSFVPGTGIAELTCGQNATGIISEQLASVDNPVFGCTEYALVHEAFPLVPNVAAMLVEETVRRVHYRMARAVT